MEKYIVEITLRLSLEHAERNNNFPTLYIVEHFLFVNDIKKNNLNFKLYF